MLQKESIHADDQLWEHVWQEVVLLMPAPPTPDASEPPLSEDGFLHHLP